MAARKKHKNRVISRGKVRAFLDSHRGYEDSREALLRWYKLAERAVWLNFADVRRTFPNADQVGEFTIFNVGGNKYRLVASVYYKIVPDPEVKVCKVLVRHILTHAEYDEGKWRE